MNVDRLPSPSPRCPFALLDLGAYESCPGFERVPMGPLHLPWFSSRKIPAGAGFSCGHLRPAQGRRGAVAVCRFPGGLPRGAKEAFDRARDRLSRRAARI